MIKELLGATKRRLQASDNFSDMFVVKYSTRGKKVELIAEQMMFVGKLKGPINLVKRYGFDDEGTHYKLHFVVELCKDIDFDRAKDAMEYMIESFEIAVGESQSSTK